MARSKTERGLGNVKKKIWVLLGYRGDGNDDGDEVIEAWSYKPTKKEQIAALRQHILDCYEVKDAKELQRLHGALLSDEVRAYTEAGHINLATTYLRSKK